MTSSTRRQTNFSSINEENGFLNDNFTIEQDDEVSLAKSKLTTKEKVLNFKDDVREKKSTPRRYSIVAIFKLSIIQSFNFSLLLWSKEITIRTKTNN